VFSQFFSILSHFPGSVAFLPGLVAPCLVAPGLVASGLVAPALVQAWSAHGDLWWRNFVSFSGKLGWALGRDIERHKREREEEMRKQQGGRQELLVWFYTTSGWRRRYKQTDAPPRVNINWYIHIDSRGKISMMYIPGHLLGKVVSFLHDWHGFLTGK
jgi:hypothetical protein